MPISSNSVHNPLGRPTTGGTSNTNEKNVFSTSNSLGVSEGQLIKGTVTDIQGSRITIQRDSGATFTGHLSEASQYSIGQRAAFQVTSASVKSIHLKALSDAYILNPDDTAFKALEEAGLPKSPRNIELVRSLLSTQQSVSKTNIMNALRFCAQYPKGNVNSVLTMKHLSFPITEENVIQFEQYQNKTHHLINKMGDLANSINEVLNLVGNRAPNASGNIGAQFLDMALENSTFLDSPSISQLDTSIARPGELLVSELTPDGTPLPKGNLLINGQLIAAEIVDGEIILADALTEMTELTEGPLLPEESELPKEIALPKELSDLIQNTSAENITLLSHGILPDSASVANEFTKGQIGNLLHSESLNEFHSFIEELPLPEQLKQDIQNGTASVKDVLSELRTILPSLHSEVSSKLLSSSGFQALLKDQFLSGWTISPEAFKESENIDKLYEKLERQLESISKFSETVISQKAFSDMGATASNMQDNLNFIKMLNQNLTYMQLPLKLSEKNAHGDLYVMTKKDALKKHPDKLRVLLHLELDHLGTLDVHIERDNLNVKTKFYVEDKKTIRLFEKNIELLSDSLIEQGYLLTNETHLHEKDIDIVKDFIAQDVPIGDMKRYNFDLRA